MEALEEEEAEQMEEKANIDTDIYNAILEDGIPNCLQYFLGIQNEEDDCCAKNECDISETCPI